jgi:FkbM family methyltransferase
MTIHPCAGWTDIVGSMSERRSQLAASLVRERVIPVLSRYRWPAVAAYYLRKAADQQLRSRFVGTYDPNTNGEYWLLDQVGPRVRTAFDVGANEGFWAQALLDRSPGLERLCCWEPGADAFASLQRRLGGDGRVALIPAAVADRGDASVEFFEAPGEPQVSSLYAGSWASGSRRTTVPVVSLDDEIARIGCKTVDLLKVDAEGADYRVLRGAEKSLKGQSVRIIQFEYHRPWLLAGATLHAALHFLATCQYETFLLNGTGLCRFDAARAPELFHYMNFVALAKAHRDFVQLEIHPDPLWG